MVNFQIVYYFIGFPIWLLMNLHKSPFVQYYITMNSLLLYTNELKYLTMYGELISFINLASFIDHFFSLASRRDIYISLMT